MNENSHSHNNFMNKVAIWFYFCFGVGAYAYYYTEVPTEGFFMNVAAFVILQILWPFILGYYVFKSLGAK